MARKAKYLRVIFHVSRGEGRPDITMTGTSEPGSDQMFDVEFEAGPTWDSDAITCMVEALHAHYHPKQPAE